MELLELDELLTLDELIVLEELEELIGGELEPPPPPPHAVSVKENTISAIDIGRGILRAAQT